jgi:hypothetical protein
MNVLNNTLGLPIENFGLMGIRAGDSFAEALSKNGFQEARYDLKTQKIKIPNSMTTEPDQIRAILKNALIPLLGRHYNYYPFVENKRDERGNLQFRISLIRKRISCNLTDFQEAHSKIRQEIEELAQQRYRLGLALESTANGKLASNHLISAQSAK